MDLPSFKIVSVQKPREIAAQILRRREGGTGDYVEVILEKALARARLSTLDRALCRELVFGVVRWQATLDWLIGRKTDGRTQKAPLQDLLRLGLYQIFWLDRIPSHAAVHETVETARRMGCGPQTGFVNAVLRGCLRESQDTRKALTELKATRPDLGYSHPEWLVSRWQQRWGRTDTIRLMEWNNTPPATYARVNRLKADPSSLLTQWRDEEVTYSYCRSGWFDENLVFQLKSHPLLADLTSFRQGQFYVQDPSTLLAPHELDPQPGETILDLCAAPGGKTTYLAQMMRDEGRIVAHDISPDRLKLVQENCIRLGVTCVEGVLPSVLSREPELCDRVLVDAPCSNTGVMRRRVDLRWRVRPEELARLQGTQLSLLEQAASLLKAGGTLVYSTCSLEPEENQEVVRRFLQSQAGFQLERERQLLPFIDSVDGAFVARLVRD